MNIIRTVHPVGHGVFISERFYDNNQHNLFNVVYDCGSDSILPASLYSIIDNEFESNDIIDIVFISHFHDDHINGIPYLINHCTVKRVVVPFVGEDGLLLHFIHNQLYGNRNLFPLIESLCISNTVVDTIVPIERIATPSHSIKQFTIGEMEWVFKTVIPPPYKSQNTHNNSIQPLVSSLFNHPVFHSVILNQSPLQVDYSLYRSLLTNPVNLRWIKKQYQTRRLHDNKYNLILCSGPQNITLYPNKLGLYTGDFEAALKYRIDYVMLSLRKSRHHILFIQAPHHGSKQNHNMRLYRPNQMCFICDSSSSRRPIGTINSFHQIGCQVQWVSEQQGSILRRNYYL